MTSNLPIDIQKEIEQLKSEFNFFSDWTERYQYLIEMADRMPPFPPELQTEDYKFHGCQSQVWLHHEYRDGRIWLQGYSDSKIVQGLIAVLLRVYSGRTPDEILASSTDFLKELGFAEHLSPNRSTGLFNMVEAIHAIAAQYRAT